MATHLRELTEAEIDEVFGGGTVRGFCYMTICTIVKSCFTDQYGVESCTDFQICNTVPVPCRS